MRHGFILLLLALSSFSLQAQNPGPVSGYFTDPRSTPYGIVCTNDYASALYLVIDGSLEELISGSGSGSYYTMSFDRARIGLKLVDENGNQTPVLFDLSSRQVTALSAPAPRAGQVSFSRDGLIAFTQGEELVILDGNKKRTYSLGTYANLAPLSPDGNLVAYNDNGDQIWLFDLTTGKRSLISDGKLGYFNPLWSPDGSRILYSSLNGLMKVYDLTASLSYDLGEGFHGTWSADSKQVTFYRKEYQGTELVNTDLYVSAYDGSVLRQITATPDVMEMDPSFSDNDRQIVFQTYARRSIGIAPLTRTGDGIQKLAVPREIALPSPDHLSIKPACGISKVQNTLQLDIPYVHQAYDTPDWFNGDAACAPTEAIMLLAYFHILPPWNTPCSTPSFHYSDWGNYVCTPYQFRQIQYNQKADDSNSKPAWGGYGYMWTGAYHPYTRMADYFKNHGLDATQTDATPFNVAFAEVSAGHPFTLCVMLTSAGHLVLAHGIGAEPHTFVFNDPWGDKNRGYPNWNGKGVSYDWPGYNNGFQNLTGVAWCIATRYVAPVASDTVIDDLQFARGFVMQTAAPSSMTFWMDANIGYLGHSWFAYSRNGGPADTCFATWTPTLPEDGLYEVSAYVPSFAYASDARYKITFNGGTITKKINQSTSGDTWVSLGSYAFSKGSGGSVRLGDISSISGQIIAFDAVRWSRVLNVTTGVTGTPGIPHEFALHQNYPNPFNPSTAISFQLTANSFVSLKIFDALGREVAALVNEVRPAGFYTLHWDGSALPSGVYYYCLRSGALEVTRKMVLMK